MKLKNNKTVFLTYKIETALNTCKNSKMSENGMRVFFVDYEQYLKIVNHFGKKLFLDGTKSNRSKDTDRKIFNVAVFCLAHFIFIVFYFKAFILFYQFVFFVKFIFITFGIRISQQKYNKSKILNTIFNEFSMPSFTILIPLYKEDKVLKQLIKSINRIDYPKCLLQILILVEEDDNLTRECISNIKLPENSFVIVVPDSEIKTKPKAMNYASNFITGEFFTIYDAEDIPSPKQLISVVRKFNTLDPDNKRIAIQCPLTWYNANDSIISRMLYIEYAKLFEILTPVFSKMETFIPLGGTSNHCKTEEIEKLNFWDSTNVTEDFELATRISLANKRIGFAKEITEEAAVVNFVSFVRQRTRWIKGFIVSISETFFDIHVKALKNPLVLIGYYVFGWLTIFHPIVFNFMMIKFILYPAMNFSILQFITMLLIIEIFTIKERRLLIILRDAIFFPFYNMLIIFPFLRALNQILFYKSFWDKTNHSIIKK